jgi:hypothetical protein
MKLIKKAWDGMMRRITSWNRVGETSRETLRGSWE